MDDEIYYENKNYFPSLSQARVHVICARDTHTHTLYHLKFLKFAFIHSSFAHVKRVEGQVEMLDCLKCLRCIH